MPTATTITQTSIQQANLARVRSKIAPVIQSFCQARIGQIFTAADLCEHVWVKAGRHIAPASPDRVLRSLKDQGYLDYELVSRAKSTYRVLWA